MQNNEKNASKHSQIYDKEHPGERSPLAFHIAHT